MVLWIVWALKEKYVENNKSLCGTMQREALG